MKKSDPPIIVKVTYPVSIEKVWTALTEVEKMTQWFFNNIPSFRPEIGFQTQFVVENEGRTFTHLWEIIEVMPLQKIAYNWKYKEYTGDGYVVFELSKVPEGTLLQLTNIVTNDYPSNIPEFKRESCIAGWEYFLAEALKKHLTYPPSLYDWAGGTAAFENLITKFYEKVVQDDLLKPIFQNMSKKHQMHVAHFIIEVFGGPKAYTNKGGSHYGMVHKHLGKYLTEQHRQRFVKLLLETADEVGLPADPEFRSAFVGYLEWGTRIAVINSNETELDMNVDAPMPTWGWGETGGPYIPE